MIPHISKLNNFTEANKLRWIKYLVFISIMVNASGLLMPIFGADDPFLYASIAKHIAIHNNWSDLVVAGKPWLDKPHFPFWVEALSFKLFGITPFAYMLPGFLFYLIGGVYTYKLANKFSENKSLSLLAVLCYFTAIHLMISGTYNIRAEAFLLGEIMPAIYYWLCYYQKYNIKLLFLGAIFTALAMMTKGIFALLTIFSGILLLAVYEKRLLTFFSWKWLSALLLSFIFILPELIVLHLQFYSTHESGIKWFFFWSQFGRFFDNGRIVRGHYSLDNFLFFFHTFLWSFLPWAFMFVYAGFVFIKNFLSYSVEKKRFLVFLASYFVPTFLMFSLTSFQLDYYINIIFPFSAIATAIIINDWLIKAHKVLSIIQWCVLSLMLLLFVTLNLLLINQYGLFYQAGLLLIVSILLLIIIYAKYRGTVRIISLSIILICSLFGTVLLVTVLISINYNLGYQLKKYLREYNIKHLYVYRIEDSSLNFYDGQILKHISTLKDFLNTNNNCILTKNTDWRHIKSHQQIILIKKFSTLSYKQFPATLFNKKLRQEKIINYSLGCVRVS